MKGLELFVFPQMVFTIFLVALLWALHARLRRQAFFWWWACGWTSFALFLSLAALRMEVPRDWTMFRHGIALVMMAAGFIQVPFLLFGAWSLQSPTQPSRQWVRAGVAIAVAAGLVGFALSVFFRDLPLASFTARNVARTLSLSLALFFCAVVLLRRWRASRSWAAGVTGGFCLLYGFNQSLYTLSLVSYWAFGPDTLVRRLLDPMGIVQSQMFLVDLIASCGTCLGLVLMLVEEHQHAERALLASVSRGEEIALANATLRAEIAERLRIEEALRDSEDRYRDLVENSEDLICTHDLAGRILSINAVAARGLGYPVEELLGARIPQFLRQDRTHEFAEYLKAVEATGVAKGLMSVRTRSGEKRFWEFHCSLRTEGVPSPIVRGIAHDVTERVEAERALKVAASARQEAESQQRAILKALPDRMHLITMDGLLLDYHTISSPDFPERQAPNGKHLRDLLPADIASGLERCCAEAMSSDEAATFEYSVPANGSTHFYEARIVRCDRDKFLSIIRDITERTRAENEARDLRDALAHVGRVTTLGAMTGSLAHEINQPLAAISINARAAVNMVGNQTIDAGELTDAMREIIADTQRAGDVLYRLRKLLVKGISERTPLDIRALVDEVLRLVKGELIARRIVIAVDVEPRVPEVLGDRVQLQQVILNLLINAFEAVRPLGVDDRRVTLRVGVDGSQVVVSVVDSGDGLPDSQIDEIFEAFYTTKDGGMGLGLTICRMIVTAHGGTLTAVRNPDRGMTFSFRLDAAGATAGLRSAHGSLEASPFV